MIKNVVAKTFSSVWPMLVIFSIGLITTRIAYILTHKEKVSLAKEFLGLIFLIYILLLFQLLTLTEINTNSGINYVPFTEIFRYQFGSRLFFYNVLGNVLLFIPFGYFISYYIKAKRITPLIFITIILSASVELVQLKIGRSFDIDDILLNVLGAGNGYLFYIGVSALKRHLPKFMQSDLFYNLLFLLLIIVFVILFLRYFKLGI